MTLERNGGIKMAYGDKNNQAELPHSVILEGRERLSLSGVTDVSGFDEEAIYTETCKGRLSIHGSGLHIEKLSLDTGEMVIEGLIDRLEYETEVRSGGFFSRIFG